MGNRLISRTLKTQRFLYYAREFFFLSACPSQGTKQRTWCITLRIDLNVKKLPKRHTPAKKVGLTKFSIMITADILLHSSILSGQIPSPRVLRPFVPSLKAFLLIVFLSLRQGQLRSADPSCLPRPLSARSVITAGGNMHHALASQGLNRVGNINHSCGKRNSIRCTFNC